MYKAHIEGVEQMIPLSDFVQKECPISILSRTPAMEVLAQELLQANAMKEHTGAILFGGDMAEWDCRWFDANKFMVAEGIRLNEAIEFHKQNNTR